MILSSSCGCLRPTHWSQVLSREWRCSWSSAERRCSNYIWVINNFIANLVRLILEVWRLVDLVIKKQSIKFYRPDMTFKVAITITVIIIQTELSFPNMSPHRCRHHYITLHCVLSQNADINHSCRGNFQLWICHVMKLFLPHITAYAQWFVACLPTI